MDFRISIQFICILLQSVRLHLCCNLADGQIQLITQSFLRSLNSVVELEDDLEPKNLSMTITHKEAILTWSYNVSKEHSSNMFYHFYLKGEELVFLKNEKVSEGKTVLHLLEYTNGDVCIKVVPFLNDDECQSASEIIICANPGTIDVNIQCVVYNISSMTCTWTYSENASYNTEHTLSLQQDTTTIDCKQYINDGKMKMGNCTFHDLNINYFKEVTVFLNRKGSDEYVIKDWFIPAEKEILNPPTNVTVRHDEENVILSWNSPDTKYLVTESCFEYQIEKNKELMSNVRNPQSMSNFDKKCLIRIRAKGEHSCGLNTNWGQWSEEISCDAPQKQSAKSELIWIILLGLSVFIIVLTIIISMQYKRISNSFFPRIPQPINYMDEAQGCNTNAVSKEDGCTRQVDLP
ncbi:interleukin-5 receptor subunit alpha-like isoform 2-T2 [Anomaloglossus baeobatrachus]|uniref:interleukin-5 receptor subunit alpha-like isoform X2 n=1 Tax=Anomaloglossus baeobatrachus TaxID=238106 RepID=UPI003F4F98A9